MGSKVIQYVRDMSTTPTGLAVGAVATAAVAAATVYGLSGPKSRPVPLDMDNQSIELADGSRTSVWTPTEEQLTQYLYEDAKTTHECFKRGLKLSRNMPCLGTRNGPNREYRWLTYYEVYEMVKNFGAGMLDEGLEAKNSTIVGIYSMNRAEWVVAEQACSMYSMVTCALYDTLGPDTCAYIINQTQMTVVICDRPEKAAVLIKQADKLASLKTIILMDAPNSEISAAAETAGIQLRLFADVMANGKKAPKEPVPSTDDDVAFICYTSGTTGDPKGAMLTNKNVVSSLSSIALFTEKCSVGIKSSDCHISYLPLAHVFERGVQVIMFMHGARIGFSSGDVKLLTDDMSALKPTIFPTVPRLLNRMHDKVLAGVRDSTIKSTLLRWALAAKEKELRRRIIRRDSIWDKLVFKKIQNLLGGRVRLVFSASAPLDPKVLNFARAAFGCVVVEGYGQTESTAGISFNVPGDYISGHTGPPLPCNIIKLVDVPEMDYYAKDKKGEIVIRGPNVFIGYYKNPEKTREALTEDGWLHTGDVGQWMPEGTLKIIDRKKNIFKLAQGEYVAAEKIENIYMRSRFVAQAFVDGDSLQPCIMAVIVPDEETMLPWAKEKGIIGSFKEICANEDVKKMIFQDINDKGKQAQLKGFEMARDIVLFPELFSIENGLLTPTFKNKRPQLRKYFKQQIQDLYAKHSST